MQTISHLRPQAVKAILVAQVERVIGVEVLDLEGVSLSVPLGRRAHFFGLARCIAACEHASVAFAGKSDPVLGFAARDEDIAGSATGCHYALYVDRSKPGKSEEGGGDLHDG
jgi:hypothetical protein